MTIAAWRAWTPTCAISAIRLDYPAAALIAYERACSSVVQHGDERDVARGDCNRGNVLANRNRFDQPSTPTPRRGCPSGSPDATWLPG
jgi:hypothetical protein